MAVLATIIVLGVLIFVHELGHFLAAKAVGIEVVRFSIGLGPKVWGVRKGETEYVLSAIPLGGYVKMGGMADEILEKVEGGGSGHTLGMETRSPGPRDFDGKPIWARTVVISAGVVMNMLFALVTYTLVAGIWGSPVPATTRVGVIYTERLPAGAETLEGVPLGARLVRVADREVDNWGDVQSALLELPPGEAEVELDDPPMALSIAVPSTERERVSLAGALGPWIDSEVGAVNPGEPAAKGGLLQGDRILAVGDVEVSTWYEMVREVEARPGVRTPFLVLREGRELTRMVTPEAVEVTNPQTGETSTVGQIGVWLPLFEMVGESLSPQQAVVVGYRETVGTTAAILGFLQELVTGGVSPRSLGSIVTIGSASGQAAKQGMDFFLRFMALFSINLAILNILPIPILDGGHLVFLTVEAVRGRALSLEQRARWSQVGLIIIMGIMILALSNDFLTLLGR